MFSYQTIIASCLFRFCVKIQCDSNRTRRFVLCFLINSLIVQYYIIVYQRLYNSTWCYRWFWWFQFLYYYGVLQRRYLKKNLSLIIIFISEVCTFVFFINNIILFKGAVKPIVMLLVKELPISEKIINIAFKYLKDNQFDTQLYKVQHKRCKYGQNIVGLKYE